jgi:DNA/RNA endonuclease G (NUC1)
VHALILLLAPSCPVPLVERDGFSVCYDTQNQRALWTVHQPRPSATPSPRKPWRKDHQLNSLSASAFIRSGYHRGHLVPVADAPGSADTFLTSNAVPQDPTLNLGRWRALENQIRNQHPARVVTGAVYNDCGNDHIEAPCFLYKIAYLPNGDILAAFAENAPRRGSGDRISANIVLDKTRNNSNNEEVE